jgi:competence protein ComEC
MGYVVLYGAFYLFGILLAGLASPWTVSACVALLGLCFWLQRQPQGAFILVICLLGWGNGTYHQHIPASHGVKQLSAKHHAQNTQQRIKGIVLSDVIHKTPQKSAFTLQLTRCEDHPCTGKIKVFLTTREGKAFAGAYGQQVSIKGRMALPATAENFGGFSYANYLATQKIHGVFYGHTFTQGALGNGNLQQFRLMRFFQKTRTFLLSTFEAHLSLAHARLLGSLILGDTASPVPDALKAQFQALGLQHVLAVSGYQVQLVVLTLVLVLRQLRCSVRLQMAMAVLALWGFVLLTGAPASVLRAAAVATWICLAQAMFRKQDILQSLTLGICSLLAVWPLLVWDIGFQFSALATLGLILSARPLQARMTWLPLKVSEPLAALLAAQLWVLPLQLFHFGTFAWLFLPGNLWAGLWTTLLTWAAVMAAVFSPLFSPLFGGFAELSWVAGMAHGFFGLIDLGIRCLLAGMRVLLYMPHPVSYFPRLSPGLLTASYLLLLVISTRAGLLRRMPQRRKALNIMLLALGMSMPAMQSLAYWQDIRQCPLRVTYLSVGQGDATLIEVAGQRLLIDAGPRWKTATGFDDAGKRSILPYLRQRGITALDLVVLSHAHLDHYGGLGSLLEDIKIHEVMLPVGHTEEPMPGFDFLLRQLKAHGVKLTSATHGSLRVLSPEVKLLFWQALSAAEGHNDGSLVMQMQHQNLRFLFAGDIEKAGEAALLNTPGFVPRTDILKVPHHGSSTSSTRAFLNALQPREAVISVGERNRFRHPSPGVMERYEHLGSRVWRTDTQGAVCVCSTGKSYTFTHAKL